MTPANIGTRFPVFLILKGQEPVPAHHFFKMQVPALRGIVQSVTPRGRVAESMKINTMPFRT
jgi:hypothetical protein